MKLNMFFIIILAVLTHIASADIWKIEAKTRFQHHTSTTNSFDSIRSCVIIESYSYGCTIGAVCKDGSFSNFGETMFIREGNGAITAEVKVFGKGGNAIDRVVPKFFGNALGDGQGWTRVRDNVCDDYGDIAGLSSLHYFYCYDEIDTHNHVYNLQCTNRPLNG